LLSNLPGIIVRIGPLSQAVPEAALGVIHVRLQLTGRPDISPSGDCTRRNQWLPPTCCYQAWLPFSQIFVLCVWSVMSLSRSCLHDKLLEDLEECFRVFEFLAPWVDAFIVREPTSHLYLSLGHHHLDPPPSFHNCRSHLTASRTSSSYMLPSLVMPTLSKGTFNTNGKGGIPGTHNLRLEALLHCIPAPRPWTRRVDPAIRTNCLPDRVWGPMQLGRRPFGRLTPTLAWRPMMA